ncbi:hypothetical protein M378DRAFT_164600, partial [Amanita muscaria Koide BX008]
MPPLNHYMTSYLPITTNPMILHLPLRYHHTNQYTPLYPYDIDVIYRHSYVLVLVSITFIASIAVIHTYI